MEFKTAELVRNHEGGGRYQGRREMVKVSGLRTGETFTEPGIKQVSS